MPLFKGQASAAVAVIYHEPYGTPSRITFTPKQLGLNNTGGYAVKEIFDDVDLGHLSMDAPISVDVNPTGVQFLRFNAVSGPTQDRRMTNETEDNKERHQNAIDSFVEADVATESAAKVIVERHGDTGLLADGHERKTRLDL